MREVGEYLMKISPFIEKERTCDGWKFGEPDLELRAIGVTWMGTAGAIKQAGEKQVNLLVVHEPLFYRNQPGQTTIPSASKPVNIARRSLLEEYGMSVYRCHDGWDTYPGIGIVDSWAAALGLGKRVAGVAGAPVYKIPEVKLGELARRVNETMGLDGVRLVGDLGKRMSMVGLGIGAWGSIGILERVILAGADVMIVGETTDWSTMRSAVDSGMAMIETSHATSENFGIWNMAERLKAVFSPVPVHYFEVGCPWTMVK